MKRYIAAQAILPFIIGVFWLTPAISAMISVVDKNYAKTLVKGRISSLERVEEYPSLGRDRGKDLIVIGESSTRYGHWRILIIRIDSHVTTLWDSDRLRQDDFVSTSLSEI